MTTFSIFASGESLLRTLAKLNLIQLAERSTVITVNSSWRIAPWADIHYSNDHDWWAHEQVEGTGRKMCGYPFGEVPGTDQTYKYDKKQLCLSGPNLVWGGNSGTAAINLAVKLGAKRIYLFGYDMQGRTHWHGDHHPSIRKDFNFPMWIDRLNKVAISARRIGVEIFNCSDNTSLRCFPIVKPTEIKL